LSAASFSFGGDFFDAGPKIELSPAAEVSRLEIKFPQARRRKLVVEWNGEAKARPAAPTAV
jgi:hypothetical protein